MIRPSPHGQNIVVFDLEIKNPIDQKNVGWKDFHKMGISCGVMFDFRTMEFTVHLEDNIDAMVRRMNEAAVVSGFHIKGFDLPLLEGTPNVTPFRNHDAVYDMLEESRKSTGWNGNFPFPRGMNLDEHLKATFGPQWVKTEDGAEAPHMYQRGEMGRVISYCIADIKREVMLFEHIYSGLPVGTATHGFKKVRHPEGL